VLEQPEGLPVERQIRPKHQVKHQSQSDFQPPPNYDLPTHTKAEILNRVFNKLLVHEMRAVQGCRTAPRG
jgi:hypothetical protein